MISSYYFTLHIKIFILAICIEILVFSAFLMAHFMAII